MRTVVKNMYRNLKFNKTYKSLLSLATTSILLPCLANLYSFYKI